MILSTACSIEKEYLEDIEILKKFQ